MHVVVVDDDDAFRAVIARTLREAGYEVSEAGSGGAAMRLLSTTTPGLVITDINMPEMDGIEIIMTLRSLQPDVPIIAISGGGLLPKELLLDNAGLLGAVETIAKPFDSRQLLEAVARALGGSSTGSSTAE